MSIRTVASFIVLTMSGVQCWPNMSNIAALYTNKGMFHDFAELEKFDALLYLVIGFKSYHYISYVDVRLSLGSVIVLGGMIGKSRLTFFPVNSTSFKIPHLDGFQFLVLSLNAYEDVGFKMLDLVIQGYETKLYKYVGCFNVTNFKELRPVEISVDCELHCSSTPFYGFNKDEQCLCIESLPKVESDLPSCRRCSKKEAVLCGYHESITSLYSKNTVQEVLEMDPSLFERCVAYGDGCPGCSGTRDDYLCQRIGCYNDPECGKLICYRGFRMHKTNFDLCLCAEGLYIDDAMECHDIDECIEDEACKGNRTCVNTYRSYLCKCDAGLREVGDIICVDIDECQGETDCDIYTTTCKNLYRDYECVCLDGYVKVGPMFRNSSCYKEESSTGCPWKLIILIILSILGAVIIWYYRKKKKAVVTT